MPNTDRENPWSPWVSQHISDTFAHPDAPDGGIGSGFSREVWPSGTDVYGGGTPDPHSPVGNKVTPWQATIEYAKFELERARQRLCDSRSWDSLRIVAEQSLGDKSFGLGACYGIVKNPVMSVVGLLELMKTLIEADLYERLTQRVTWKTMLKPGGGLGLPELSDVGYHLAMYAGVLSIDDLKRSYESREALIKNVEEMIKHPVDTVGKMTGQVKAEYVAKWNRFRELQKLTDLRSQFEAGELFGEVLMEVVMIVLTVISVGGAAVKLAAKVPQLVRLAEVVKGARAARAGGVVAEAGEVVKGAGAASTSFKTVEAVSGVATKRNEAFFWSGRTSGVGGEKVAAEIAAKNNGVTLETLIADRNIKMPAWDEANPASVKAWKDISAEYANGASGDVRAVIGQNLRADNIWESRELPALLKNPNVTSITTIDPATKQATVIFRR